MLPALREPARSHCGFPYPTGRTSAGSPKSTTCALDAWKYRVQNCCRFCSVCWLSAAVVTAAGLAAGTGGDAGCADGFGEGFDGEAAAAICVGAG